MQPTDRSLPRCLRARRTPAVPLGVPASRLRRRGPRGDRRRPQPGDTPGGLPRRAVPDGRGRHGDGDGLVVARGAGRAAALGTAGDQVDAPVRTPVRDPGGHRVRGGRRRVCGPAALGRLDRRRHRLGVHRAAPAGLGALGRGLARRRARRGPVRRGHRRAVRRGVDVHPRPRRLEGRADGPRRPAQRRVRRRAGPRHPVADPAPRDARGGGGAAAGVPATPRAGAAAPAARAPSRGSRPRRPGGRPRRRSPSAGRRRPSRSSRPRG